MKMKLLLLFLMILVVTFYFSMEKKLDFSSKIYNQKEWRDNPKNRIQMASNIIESKRLIGKDSLEIINELGISHEEIKNNNWKFLLDYEGYLNPKFYFLKLHFKNKIVDSVYIEIVNNN